MTQVLIPLQIDRTPPPWGWDTCELAGHSMGTTWSVKVVTPQARTAAWWQRGVQHKLDDVVAQMSHWDANSALGRFNHSAMGSTHALPASFFEVLRYGLRVAQDSNGAFDPCVGHIVNAWGFGPGLGYADPRFIPPGPQRIADLKQTSGWQHLPFDEANQHITQPGGMALDLSSVAKGFAVDHVSRWLESQGAQHYLVEVGGELRGAGIKPDGQPWWVALEKPATDSSGRATPMADDTLMALHGLSVATSGDYRRFFLQDGQRLAHTLDPRTGQPVSHELASVTVAHPSCMEADALSTVLLVLGTDEGIAWAEQRGIAARLLHRSQDGLQPHLTTAWQSMLQ